MAVQVVDGAVLICSFGAAPSSLSASPTSPARGTSASAATIMDFAPTANIKPFGLCSSPTNPQVAAATAAALGVLTPQPCIPATASPWVPGSPAVTIGGQPALDNTCTCNCLWAGVISVISPGQQAAQV